MIEIVIFVIIMVIVSQNNKKKKKAATQTTAPKQPTPKKEYSHVEPTKAYRAARNAAERYEEWFPVPEGKKVVRCGYCAANNLIPRERRRDQYTCYFCREEL